MYRDNEIVTVYSSEQVAAGPDAVDERIVELAEAGDLVITADIPLADRCVSKGATALDPRGRLYSVSNVKEALAVRDLMNELRSGGRASAPKTARPSPTSSTAT